MFFKIEEIKKRYDYVVLTDLDLVPSDNWLPSAVNILNLHHDVFSVSVKLDTDNLPYNLSLNYPQAIDKSPLCQIFKPGCHFTTFRKHEFLAMVKWIVANNLPFLDRTFETYGTYVLDKFTVQSTDTTCRHLSWDLTDRSTEYFRKKQSGFNIWHVKDACDYIYVDKETLQLIEQTSGHEHKHFSSIPWINFKLINDTANHVKISFDRIWADGTIQGTRTRELSPGTSQDFNFYFKGLLLANLTINDKESELYLNSDEISSELNVSALFQINKTTI